MHKAAKEKAAASMPQLRRKLPRKLQLREKPANKAAEEKAIAESVAVKKADAREAASEKERGCPRGCSGARRSREGCCRELLQSERLRAGLLKKRPQ